MIHLIKKIGITQDLMYTLGFASVGASIAIWNAKKGEDNAHAERFGIFVGLWAPTFFALAGQVATVEANNAKTIDGRS